MTPAVKSSKRHLATALVHYRRIADLTLDPKNARLHPDWQIAQIAESIRVFGFVNPVLVDARGKPLAGHGRVAAAKKLGYTEVPTICISHLTEAQARAFAIVGMGALFAATVRAPLTGIVLMLEMTEGYSLMLPLLAATFVGQWTADLAGDRPIYEALLERELARSAPAEPERPESILHEVDVHPGAPFDSRRVAELGLPKGCLIVAIERRGEHLVASGDTVLAAGDRLTVVLASDAGDALARLTQGAGGD